MSGAEDHAASRPDEHGMTVGRVAAFSDGMFAIAMTVLVLTLSVPAGIKTASALNAAVRDEIPALLSFALSFAVIGRYWVAHHGFMRRVARVNAGFLGWNLLLLGCIALVPFPTGLLGNYGAYVVPTVLYACSIGSVGLVFGLMGWYTLRAGLVQHGCEAEMRSGIVRSWMVPVVFLSSVPVTIWVGTGWGKYWWLLMWPVGIALGHIARRREALEVAHG